MLIDRGIDHSQIAWNSAGLGAFARAKKSGNGDRREQRNDCDDNHDFNEREALVRFGRERIHIYKGESTRHAHTSVIDKYTAWGGEQNAMSDLPLEEHQALAEFRYLLRKFLRFSKDLLLSSGGLNPEQYEALLAIKAFASPEGLNISQLSERLQIKHHSAVNIVDRLVERKLITRETAEGDRRRRHVNLTPKGERFIDELAGLHRKEIRNRSAEIIKALERLKK